MEKSLNGVCSLFVIQPAGLSIYKRLRSVDNTLATLSMQDGNATETVNKLVEPNDCRRKPVVLIVSIE